MGGIGVGPLLVILTIVVLLFGTKKLRSLGRDVGEAARGFREGLHGSQDSKSDQDNKQD